MLFFSDGRVFASGSMPFYYPSSDRGEASSRILLTIEIAGQRTEAILDTGAPYVVCHPRLAPLLQVDSETALEDRNLLIRGSWVRGVLHRLPVRFPAEAGQDLYVDATVFLPDPAYAATWGNLPSFIGLSGCLERMRFALDPDDDAFYFGPLEQT